MKLLQERTAKQTLGESLIIQTSVRIMVPFIQLYGLYVIVHGHYSPGGGFQGGGAFERPGIAPFPEGAVHGRDQGFGDIESGDDRKISIRVPHDGLASRPTRVSAAGNIEDFGLSPKGERAVFVARGDLAGWPLLGFLTRSVGTLYVDRGELRSDPASTAATRLRWRR